MTSPDQLRAFLDGLAALCAVHGLMLDSYGLRLCAGPPGSPGLGGYIAVPRGDGIPCNLSIRPRVRCRGGDSEPL